MAGYDIDKNVRSLVKVLNELPGVHTCGCCGGHENPSAGQMPQGYFSVELTILDKTDESFITRDGWHSLGIIDKAVTQHAARVLSMEDSLKFDTMFDSPCLLLVSNLCDDTDYDCCDFSIQGKPGSDPAKLARIIRNRLKKDIKKS